MVRKYQKTEEFEKAVDKAADECIKNDILKEFLEKHRREVKNMCLTEFDEKKYEEVLKDDAVSFHTYSLVSRGLLTIEEGA